MHVLKIAGNCKYIVNGELNKNKNILYILKNTHLTEKSSCV